MTRTETTHTHDEANALLAEAGRLVRTGKVPEAGRVAASMVRDFPGDPRGWHMLSDLLLRTGQTDKAVETIDRAIALAPNEAALFVQKGRASIAQGDFRGALSAAHHAQALKPRSAGVFDGIGSLLSACDEQDAALRMFERAAEMEPEDPAFLFNLATAQRFAGQFEAAEKALDRVIALNQRDYGAYHTRADLRRQTPEANHVDEMERLLHAGIDDWRGEVQVRYALAKECEDLGQWDRAFAHLSAGATLRRSNTRYDVADDISTIDRIIDVHTKDTLGRLEQGYPSPEPIFVLGLPRTGTTLVERILASHTQVYAAGELRDFPGQMVRLIQRHAGEQALSRDTMVARSLEIGMGELGRAYLDATRPATGHTPHFIDKLPLNFLYCGLIHAALPNARIVHLVRNPMDTCYAIYKTLFSQAYPFSYDLEDLGRYYLAYRRLMAHWHDTLPGTILDVRYEDLVEEPETESRRLVGHCGLDWEDACLDFHRRAEASTTASAVQVRQPVYTSSVGKWRRYEAQLQPLVRLLEDHGIKAI